jgi:hypothetical protein
MPHNYDIYKKVYQEHYGPIPRELDGRSYEVHHIDGNPDNNIYTNLKAVSIQEHYDIHYAQQDWGACFAIATRMKIKPEDFSKLASIAGKKSATKRIEAGTHNFQIPNFSSNIQLKRIKENNHHFIGKSNPVYNQLLSGTHSSQKEYKCPHCNKTGKGGAMIRYHFDRCKLANINADRVSA